MVQEMVVVAERMLQHAEPGSDPGRYLVALGWTECNLGEIRLQLNMAGWEEAIRSGLIRFRTAADGSPLDGFTFKSIGEWRSTLADDLKKSRPIDAQKEHDLAIEAYQHALTLNPDDRDARDALRELTATGPG